MLPAALSGQPVCHCGHKAEWPSWSGLGTQQRPAGTKAWHTRRSEQPPWLRPGCPGLSTLLRILSSAEPRHPPACLVRGFTHSPALQAFPPSSLQTEPHRVVHGGQGRLSHAGVLCLPTYLSAWALPGQSGWWPGERRRDPRTRPCPRGTTDL